MDELDLNPNPNPDDYDSGDDPDLLYRDLARTVRFSSIAAMAVCVFATLVCIAMRHDLTHPITVPAVPNCSNTDAVYKYQTGQLEFQKAESARIRELQFKAMDVCVSQGGQPIFNSGNVNCDNPKHR